MVDIRATGNASQGTSKLLASLLGLTQRRVQQLTVEGVLSKEETGKYNLSTAIQAYIEFVRCDGQAKPEQQVDYWAERTKHETAKRKMTEIRLAKIERRMHDARDIEIVMTDMLSNLRSQLMGMPAMLSGELVGKSQEELYTILTSAIESKLLELSDYSPTMFDSEDDEEITEE